MKYIIEFEDNGQDFLTWTCDEDGLVIDAKPFQSSIWGGCNVVGVYALRKRSTVCYVGKDGKPYTLKHKVERVTKTA